MRRIKRLLLFSALAGFGPLFLQQPAAAQTPVGNLTRLSGSAQVTRASTTLNAVAAMPLILKDSISTASTADATVTLRDNSTLDIGGDSTIVLDSQTVGSSGQVQSTVTLLGGEVTSAVTHAVRTGAPTFQINTPNAIAGVRGTKFTVHYSTSSPVCGSRPSTDIAVDQGLVEASNPAAPGAIVPIPAGYETVVCGNSAPLPPGPLGLAGDGSFGAAASGNASPPPSAGGSPPPVCPVWTPAR